MLLSHLGPQPPAVKPGAPLLGKTAVPFFVARMPSLPFRARAGTATSCASRDVQRLASSLPAARLWAYYYSAIAWYLHDMVAMKARARRDAPPAMHEHPHIWSAPTCEENSRRPHMPSRHEHEHIWPVPSCEDETTFQVMIPPGTHCASAPSAGLDAHAVPARDAGLCGARPPLQRGHLVAALAHDAAAARHRRHHVRLPLPKERTDLPALRHNHTPVGPGQ